MDDYLDSNDYYKTLGILKQASGIEVKKAYRRLARKYHPDRNSDVSDDVMKNINIAFEVLSDPDKRKEYDEKTIDRVLENSDKIDNRHANNNANRGNHQSYDEIGSPSSYGDTAVDHFSNYYSFDDVYFKSQKAKIPAKNTLDIPKGRYQIIVEPSLCLAFGSCETLAPKVFVVEKDKPINPKAVVMSETGTDFETILDAAKTCPTKAIIIIDRYSGERIYP
ncbi:MAG: DnaJ domain-containing protein [Candidatus Nitrosocosmicus sp.]